MPELEQRTVNSDGSVYYEPIVLKVRGQSDFNADQISFEGVPGFWQLPDGLPTPPPGTIARFTLKTKPKTSPRARPGSKYQDIVTVTKASADEYSGPPAAPQAHAGYSDGDYQQKEVSGASQAQPVNHWDVRDQQIKLGMAFNNLTVLLSSGVGLADLSGFVETFGFDSWTEACAQWERWYTEASHGLPLSPVQDEVEEQEDEASENTEADPEGEDVPQYEEIEEMPW